jgi:hypothetical protein
VHGGELIEDFRLNELQARLKEFSPDAKGEHTTNHQHREAEPEVEGPDVFVIGGKKPAFYAVGVVMGMVVGCVATGVKNCTHVFLLTELLLVPNPGGRLILISVRLPRL